MAVPIAVPGEGFRVGFRGGWGGWFSFGKWREKGRGGGEGGGGGVGTGKGTGKSMRKLCRNYPLANYPLVSPRPEEVRLLPGRSQELLSESHRGIKVDGFQNGKAFLVPVCFGTRLSVSLTAPKGVSKRLQNG